MKKTEKMITVRGLIRELSKVSKGCEDYDMVLWTSGDNVFCVTETYFDENGEVCIWVEEECDDGGYYTVDMLKDELEDYDESDLVYLAGDGRYMTFEQYGDIFTEDHDSEIVGAYVEVFGHYVEEDDEVGGLTIEDRIELAKVGGKQRR